MGLPVGGDPAGGGVPLGQRSLLALACHGAGVPIASFKFAHGTGGAPWEYCKRHTAVIAGLWQQPAGGSSRLSNPALPFEVRLGTMTTEGNAVQ